MIDLMGVTQVERRGSLFFKRDDLFEFEGMRGAKVRAAYGLVLRAKEAGCSCIVSHGSRYSPQLGILSVVGKSLGVGVHGFVASGNDTPVVNMAKKKGAIIHYVKDGHSPVVRARAVEFASENGFPVVPFGMRDDFSVGLTKSQAVSLFRSEWAGQFRRVVVAAGSGVNLAGIILGMRECGVSVPVLAVMVGHDCIDYVEELCGSLNNVSFIQSSFKYNREGVYSCVNGVDIDLRYESKVVPFLEGDDLFWLVGLSFSSLVRVRAVI
jgi:1-aminocyclopropane-1-carboxylate deaminase/D-cysteine desulfhydrase-like pyridoxal-dependent ACC family enzyme